MKRLANVVSGFAVCSLFVAVAPAVAQQTRPPRPDIAKMASSMGVPEDALKSCMGPPPSERPANGERPPRPDIAKIAACLKEQGHDVTDQSVGDVFAANRPPRRQ